MHAELQALSSISADWSPMSSRPLFWVGPTVPVLAAILRRVCACTSNSNPLSLPRYRTMDGTCEDLVFASRLDVPLVTPFGIYALEPVIWQPSRQAFVMQCKRNDATLLLCALLICTSLFMLWCRPFPEIQSATRSLVLWPIKSLLRAVSYGLPFCSRGCMQLRAHLSWVASE